MKPLVLALLLTCVLALPNPEAEPQPEALAKAEPLPDSASDSLENLISKRACTDLSYQKCHKNPSSTRSGGGVYCGYCVEVVGTDWTITSGAHPHKWYAYQLNGRDGSCCSYGYRTSCESKDGDRSQCPI